MKTRRLEMQSRKELQDKRGKVLPTIALFGALLGSPSESYAQSMHNVDDGKATMEIVQKDIGSRIAAVMPDGFQIPVDEGVTIKPDPEGKDEGVTIKPDPEGKDEGVTIEPDPEGKDERITIEPDPKGKDDGKIVESDLEGKDDGGLEGEKKSQESRIGVHGFVQVGTSVVPDFAGIFSDKASAMIGIDAKDKKTGLGLTVIRLDDFHTDPEYPLSRASVVVPYRTISSKDGKRSAGASVECSFIDQMPETVGVTPVVVGTYSKGGRTLEGKYFHDIVKGGEDMDAFRLGITKKIGDILSLTAHGWYKSDYEGKFYGRVIADVDLGGGFGAQLSCIAKDGKLTPTGGVIYKF